jgi:hypothetical protein
MVAPLHNPANATNPHRVDRVERRIAQSTVMSKPAPDPGRLHHMSLTEEHFVQVFVAGGG